MGKNPSAPTAVKKPKAQSLEDGAVELLPDAWERFERAVDQVAKSPPQHRTKPLTATPKPKPRKSDKAAR